VNDNQAIALYRADLLYKRESQRIRKILSELRNPARMAKALHRSVAESGILSTMIDNRFQSSGATQGEKWPALTKKTIIDKRRQGFGATAMIPLVRSGALRAAAVEGDTISTPEIVGLRLKRRAAPTYLGKGRTRKAQRTLKLRDDQLIFESLQIEVYAQVLNNGGGPKNLPRRPFYDPPKGQERAPIDQLRKDLFVKMYRGIMSGMTLEAALPKLALKRGRKAGGA
jgi:hypothetical protein